MSGESSFQTTLKSSFPSESHSFPALEVYVSLFHVFVVSVAYRTAVEPLASGEKDRGMMLTIVLGGSAMHSCD